MQHRTIAELAGRWLSRNADALTDSERRVLQSAIDRKTVSFYAGDTEQQITTAGARIADAVARIGGSWSFIISFLVFLVAWALFNSVLLVGGAFDPYPYIFLNLVLSMLAAIQAPVIMMSQNRQAERDRAAAAHDYEVNLKAEIEIMALHEKLDELRHSQIMVMRDDIASLTEKMQRIENKLIQKPASSRSRK